MIDFENAVKEFHRHTLMTYGEILLGDGYESDLITDDQDNWNLNVKVPGPSGYSATFSLTNPTDDAVTLSAFYTSPLVDEALSEIWTIADEDDPQDICDELITYFVIDCADKEFETILVPTMVNDSNLEHFVALLSDKILTEENEYALGVYIQDEGGLEVAAACGFFITEDELIIEDINVRFEYDDLGIEDYMLRYIQKMVMQLDLF